MTIKHHCEGLTNETNFKIGDVYHWEIIGGEVYHGLVEEIDSNVLYVRLDNGELKTVET